MIINLKHIKYFSNPVINKHGLYTNYTLGNGLQHENTFTSDGRLSRMKAGIVFDMEYDFDDKKASLNSRKDRTRFLVFEEFTYDNLNRLFSQQNNTTTFIQNNGNIGNHTFVGTLNYDQNAFNQATEIVSPQNLCRSNTQIVTYTDFDRTATITENDYILTLHYGPHKNRKKTILTHQNNTVYTRFFIGNYEKTIREDNGQTLIQQVHYIPCGQGVEVMYVIEGNGNVGNYFYPHKDYLGSILAVSDDLGNIVAEQNFDAWGRYRNPDDWSYSNVPTVPTWLYRGYTGHEMLPEFTLINMNNRMYDPEIGRFLAVDNFVLNPYSTQDYNRYTYANNNPLMYTDPDGEAVVAAIVIGTVIMGYNGYKIGQSHGATGWELAAYTLGGAVIGAVSGGVGGMISASGAIMANTMGTVFSSYIASVGFAALGGRGANPSVNFGFGSYTFGEGINTIGSDGNKWYQNLGYVFGGMGNLSDMGKTGDMIYNVERKHAINHAAIKETNGNTVISYGPGDSPKYDYLNAGESKVQHYGKMLGGISGTNNYPIHGRDIGLKEVNTTMIKGYGKMLSYLSDKGLAPYSFAYSSCSTHAGLAMWFAGVPNLFIHPYTLQASVWLWNNGITPALIQNSYHLTND